MCLFQPQCDNLVVKLKGVALSYNTKINDLKQKLLKSHKPNFLILKVYTISNNKRYKHKSNTRDDCKQPVCALP